MRVPALLFSLLALVSSPVHAVQPGEALADPLLEKRAREISKELRCLVCQNQSIDDSDADLAKDLRVLVRELLLDDRSDREIIDFVVDRYGDFVLLRPPVKGATIILWAGPAVFAVLGLSSVIYFYRRGQARAGAARAAAAARPLSGAERKRLDFLLKDGDGEAS